MNRAWRADGGSCGNRADRLPGHQIPLWFRLPDTEALIQGIESGKIGALALDTIEGESGIIHGDHRIDILPNRNLLYLRQFRNVIMTPHMAFFTSTALNSMVRCGLEGICRMAEGMEVQEEIR